jgi:ATP-binding cassette subfamily F protein uup
MTPPLLLLQNIAFALGGASLLEDATLAVGAGERVCLVGRNGSGKSTLLKIAAGLLQADAGRRFLQPGATLRYLPQEPDLSGHATVSDYVRAGLGPGDPPHRVEMLLDRLGLSAGQQTQTLSGGEARRAALARALAPQPDILLLDEPTNHLDLPAIAWLEAELAGLAAAVVLVSHDRRLLETLGQAVVWLDRGATRRLERGFAGFEAFRDDALAQEEQERHKLSRKIAAEEDWLRYGVTARRKRNQKRLAGLHALRERRRSALGPAGRVRLAAAEADISGRLVIDAEGVEKRFADAPVDAPVVRDLTLRVLRGDRLGIVGPNGAGKTTLLHLLTGRMAPDLGRVRQGAGLRMQVLDQLRESLDPARTLADTLTGGRGDTVLVGEQTRHVIGYMKDFLFTPAQARTPVGVLSGGERGRLALAVALARPGNLLVLDEPTNDLDLETLDLLQEMLADYAGTVLLVSHDRDFLDRVATGLLVAEGDGRWTEYAGGYSDMLAQRGAAPGAAELRAARAETRPAPPPVRQASRSAKLSFRDKHALETLPAQIEQWQREVAGLQARLADPDLYARDPAAFAATSATLAQRQGALADAEERWLELEIMREALEAS